MKISVIKFLVENHSIDELAAAEQAICNGETPEIRIEGDDEGEQLTHACAAQEVKKDIELGSTVQVAMRNFSQRVRDSIS